MTRRALGIDLGNAKVKACFWREGDKPRWVSLTTPYHASQPYERHDDFTRGVNDALRALDFDAPPDVAVCVHSSGYSYPSFVDGARHTARLLRDLLPNTESFLLSATGRCIATSIAEHGDDALLAPTAFSNGLGAAILAQRLSADGAPWSGLVLDSGGSTTAITVLDEGRIDPVALEIPELHVVHRMTHGKLVWIGAQSTPLEALAHEAPVRLAHGVVQMPVIPRGVPFRHVSTLLGLLDERRAARLRLVRSLHERSDRALALRALADAVNLDRTLCDDDALVELARFFYDRAITKLSAAIHAALRTAPPRARTRAIVFGQGAAGLGRPALEHAGWARSQITLASELIEADLADVASCYGACLLALERARGTSETVPP